jgi:hypothetical protein
MAMFKEEVDCGTSCATLVKREVLDQINRRHLSNKTILSLD